MKGTITKDEAIQMIYDLGYTMEQTIEIVNDPNNIKWCFALPERLFYVDSHCNIQRRDGK